MKDVITIQEIFQALKKRFLLILSIPIILIGLVAVISYYFITPMYQGSSQFIVIQQQGENIQLNLTELETNVELINTYNEIIKSPFILEKVIDELDLTILPEELGKRVEVESGENSQVVTVSAIDESPETAALLANTVVEQFQATIPTLMRIDNVQVLSIAKPSLAQEPIKPRPILNIFIAGVIGITTGIGLALLLEFLNTKVKLERDIEHLGIPVLGVVSRYKRKKSKRNTKELSSTQARGENFGA